MLSESKENPVCPVPPFPFAGLLLRDNGNIPNGILLQFRTWQLHSIDYCFLHGIINNLILCMCWYFHYSGASGFKDTIFLETQSPDLYMPVAFLNILSDFSRKISVAALCIGVKITKTISLFTSFPIMVFRPFILESPRIFGSIPRVETISRGSLPFDSSSQNSFLNSAEKCTMLGDTSSTYLLFLSVSISCSVNFLFAIIFSNSFLL